MGRFLLGRVVQGFVAILLITIVVFVLIRLAGDPTSTMLPLNALPEDQARLRRELGLDKPMVQQYFIYLGNLFQGDFGQSIRYRQPALDAVLQVFPATLQLAAVSVVALAIFAIPAGILAAMKRGSLLDTIVRNVAMLGNAFPSFWLGMILMLVFAVALKLLPPGGKGTWQHMVLPAVTLTWYLAGGLTRIVRSSMLEVLNKDFVRTARAKGLASGPIIWRHAFRNSLLPITTYLGVIFLRLITGAVVVETVFGWPGVGRTVMTSISFRDYPVVQTVILLLGVIFVFGNLLVDIAYFYIDPRLRRA